MLYSRLCQHQLGFLVKWSGYDTSTWEPLNCVNDNVPINLFIAPYHDTSQPIEQGCPEISILEGGVV